MDPALLALVCCPETLQPLRPATPEELALVNRAGVVNRSGAEIPLPIDGGLVRQDGAVLYPCREGIPALLGGEGISLR